MAQVTGSSEASADALGVLCRALRDDVDGLADQLTLMILDREDIYRELGIPIREDVRETCRANLERALLVLSGDVPPDTDPASLTVATAHRRARQGVPLEVVLRAYRLCGRLLWDRMRAASRDRYGGAYDRALLDVADQVWRMIDGSSARFVDAYRDEEARQHSRDLGRRYSVVEGLLDGRGSDPAYAREAALTLGLPEHGDLACVVAPVGDISDDPLRAPRETLLTAGYASLWHPRRAEVVGLVALGGSGREATAAAREVAELLEPCASGPVGVSPPVAGLAGVDAGRRLARLAARTLDARAPDAEHPAVAVLDDRLPEALLADSPEVAERLRRVVLGGLLDLPQADRRTLLRTLEVVLAQGGSPTHAAASLYCHRNTVMYRLSRIEALTARRLAEPRDRLLLSLAVLAGR
ncbi:PucR family transcriptional regulator [Actinomycetospora cinnamomea]|uniref:PucR family transcriptional regulator n=1 Tax=Actinomycetospora cinnamomea TaxID=663609 RepID=UPI001FAE9D69|nr:helix-turn-helix domain-containing protein [Actinomycetospora cinnamomea]